MSQNGNKQYQWGRAALSCLLPILKKIRSFAALKSDTEVWSCLVKQCHSGWDRVTLSAAKSLIRNKNLTKAKKRKINSDNFYSKHLPFPGLLPGVCKDKCSREGIPSTTPHFRSSRRWGVFSLIRGLAGFENYTMTWYQSYSWGLLHDQGK